jgi:hypothetical protein
MTRNDFEALADPSNGWNLGYVKEIRVPTPQDIVALPGTGAGQTIIEYSNGFKLAIDANTKTFAEGKQGVDASRFTGYSYTEPTEKKSPLQAKADREYAEAQGRLARANAEHQEAVNAGIGTRDTEAQIASATATKNKADADRRVVERELAAGKPEAEVAQIVQGTANQTTTAQASAQQAATGQGQLILNSTIAEIDRRWKEGQIDNETRRILSNHAWQRWQADNTNTQTVMSAAAKGLEADLTERNQNITLDNSRTAAANSGFSDDTKTVQGYTQWLNPNGAEDLIYNGMVGLAGLRKAQIQDWGGLQDHKAVRRPAVIEQLGYNTPIAVRSLETNDEIEQQLADIRAGRESRGIMTQPVTAPKVTPTVVTVPAPTSAPAVVVTPAPPVSTQVRDTDYRIDPQVSNAGPSQSFITSNNMLTGSTIQPRPIQYAQGGEPIAVRDLFGRTRPVVGSSRYAWLR